MNRLSLLLGFFMSAVFARAQIDVTTHADVDQVNRENALIEATQSNAAATAALALEQKKANEDKIYFERKRREHEQQLEQEKRDNDAQSTGEGTIVNDPSASKLGWFYRVYVIQKLPTGILANSWTPSVVGEVIRNKGIAYIEKTPSLQESSIYFISAYRSGTYSYTDSSGKSRVVPRYVFKQLFDIKSMQYNLNSIKEL
jgi:hypothetical protein